MQLNEIENKEFREYIEDYVNRIIIAFPGIRFRQFFKICSDYEEHYIFEFDLTFVQAQILSKEQFELLSEDDDGQPHNQYHAFLDTLYIYSTRLF